VTYKLFPGLSASSLETVLSLFPLTPKGGKKS
jgi:hypothetical protein